MAAPFGAAGGQAWRGGTRALRSSAVLPNDGRFEIQDSRREATTEPINQNEIIEDVEGQIRKCGGRWSEWYVGTAKDSRGPYFRRHLAADLVDGLIYREAYTTSAAQAVMEDQVNAHGMEFDASPFPSPAKSYSSNAKPHPPIRARPATCPVPQERRIGPGSLQPR